MNPIEMLLDENCNDPITLYSENDEPMDFQQVALIPHEGILYAILKPMGDGILAEDEALVFALEQYEGEPALIICEDDAVIDQVFAAYYELLRQSGVDV